jgi:hypothetical protein
LVNAGGIVSVFLSIYLISLSLSWNANTLKCRTTKQRSKRAKNYQQNGRNEGKEEELKESVQLE